ncbi:hypothetical protein [Streptomyces flavofungini]|uniref:hypothetical protein n=1 Tax=Streptomyces flavofungini TaxID=68200 RepID=UPI0034DEDA69
MTTSRLSPVKAALDVVASAAEESLLLAGRAAEQRHLLDPCDGAFAALACAHPEACACDTDYPDWRPGGAA